MRCPNGAPCDKTSAMTEEPAATTQNVIETSLMAFTKPFWTTMPLL